MLSWLKNWLLARRWRPVLKRLRLEMQREGKANREMLLSYAHWLEGKASAEEMKRAEKQMRELLKTIGIGGLAILPFSPITIPWLVALGNRLGIQILPDWFFRLAKSSQSSRSRKKRGQDAAIGAPADEQNAR